MTILVQFRAYLGFQWSHIGVPRRKDGEGKEDPSVFGLSENAISLAW
ncbi:MAG: hypothetical protein M0Z84_09515 [Gammaproteobacteria bacterium]|nr:hypothetical protein [Gammaproteobacteria bacterium]